MLMRNIRLAVTLTLNLTKCWDGRCYRQVIVCVGDIRGLKAADSELFFGERKNMG
jgi:hypothetical protein